ncbi:unnamed protein product, partial [Ectocarpus sp. 12 AP-2014]
HQHQQHQQQESTTTPAPAPTPAPVPAPAAMPPVVYQRWTQEQSLRLRQLVEERQMVVGTSGAKDWTNIARKIPPKTDLQCMLHWNHVINPELTKGKGSWKQEEDERIIQLVEHHGKKWSVIASQLKEENGKMTRVGKQIRERYLHHLDPNLKKGDWSVEEEEILVREHGIHKNKWAQIAKFLPGRCSNDIKNHWYAHERRQREISRASTSSAAAAAATTETPPIVVQRTARPFPMSANPSLARILPAPPPPVLVSAPSAAAPVSSPPAPASAAPALAAAPPAPAPAPADIPPLIEQR